MATRRVNGVALYYEEHGGGQPILGIHGTGSSALLWQGAIPELSRRGRLIPVSYTHLTLPTTPYV